jgi:hypothetical protein
VVRANPLCTTVAVQDWSPIYMKFSMTGQEKCDLFYFSYQKYCGTINCSRMSQDVGKLGCRNAQIPLYMYNEALCNPLCTTVAVQDWSPIYMKFSMTGQEKCDLLIQVTSL